MSGYLLLLVANNSGIQVLIHWKREKIAKLANIKCFHPDKAVNILSDVQR